MINNITMKAYFFIVLTILSIQINAQNKQSRGENFIQQIEGKLDKAKIQVDKLCSDPTGKDNPENWYLKSYVYTQIAKSQVYKNIAPDAEFVALEALKKSKELDSKKKFESDRINLLFDLSAIFYNKAILLYNEGVEKNKLNNFPSALENFEKFFECIDVLENDKVIVLNLLNFNNVTFENLYLYAGYSAHKSNQIEKAKKYYEQLIHLSLPAQQAREKGNPLAYIYYIDLMLENKDTISAINVAKKSLEIYPENPDVVMAAFDLFYRMRKLSESADLLENIFKINNNPDYKMLFVLAQTYNNLSKEYKRKGYESTADQYKLKAIEMFEKLLNSNVSDKNILFKTNYNLGVIYYNEGVAAYKKRSETNTTEYEFLFKKAIPYLEEARKYDSKNKNILNMLLKAYTSLNEKVKAEEIEKQLY